MNVLLHDDSKLHRFITGFLIAGFVFFFFMYTNQQKWISRPVNTFTAHTVQKLAQTFHFASKVDQRTFVRERGNDQIFVPTTLLRVGKYQARIILECSAVHAGILFVAFLLAYPASASQKILGMILLIPCLIIFNTVRIFILMLLGHYFGPDSTAFYLFHVYIMQALMIALVLVLALLWLRRCKSRNMDDPIWFFLRFLAISGGLSLVYFLLENRFDFHSKILENSIFPFLTLSSFVLASSRLQLKRSRKEIIMGFGIMALFLIAAQTARYLFVQHHSGLAELCFVMMESALKYILPVGLFFFLTRKRLFIRTDPSGRLIFRCPLCGKEDIHNLRAHAGAKHFLELTHGDEILMDAIRTAEKCLEPVDN